MSAQERKQLQAECRKMVKALGPAAKAYERYVHGAGRCRTDKTLQWYREAMEAQTQTS